MPTQTYHRTLFVHENVDLLVPDDCFRDKAYQRIHCETKQAAGAAGDVCNRKGVL